MYVVTKSMATEPNSCNMYETRVSESDRPGGKMTEQIKTLANAYKVRVKRTFTQNKGEHMKTFLKWQFLVNIFCIFG